jgi:hypothetical protein
MPLMGCVCAPICWGGWLGCAGCSPSFHIRTALSAPAVKTVLPSGENVEQSTGELFSWFTDSREAEVKGE